MSKLQTNLFRCLLMTSILSQGIMLYAQTSIPGKIEAESYNTASTTEVCTANCNTCSGGESLNCFGDGRWVTYNVNVSKAGKYKIDIKGKRQGSGVKLTFSGNNATANFEITTTDWESVYSDTVVLIAGNQTITVKSTFDYMDIDYFNFTLTGVIIPVTGISLDASSVTIMAKKNKQLTATVLPSDASNKSVTWTTSNSAIATVSSLGVVTGVTIGNANITATTKDGSISESCAVKVDPNTTPVTGVTVLPTSVYITVGTTSQLTATISPNDAGNTEVTWSTSNSNYVTVSSAGIVTGVAIGSAVITVTTKDGNKTADIIVAVEAKSKTDGFVNAEIWSNSNGDQVSDIDMTIDPSSTAKYTSLELASKSGWNYGLSIKGYIVPNTTGDYIFYVSGDDNVELWLSTDASETNLSRIAYTDMWTNSKQWDKTPSQKSVSKTLSSSGKYFFKVLYKNAGGGENLEIGWTGPNISSITVIGTANLLSYTDPNPRLGKALNLLTSNMSNTGFTLSWTACKGGTTPITYEVFSGSNSFGTTTATSLNVSGLTAGTTNKFYVKATDKVGKVTTSDVHLYTTNSDVSFSRNRKLGTNLWYMWSLDSQTDPNIWTGAHVFKQVNPDFAHDPNPWSQKFLDNMKIYQVIRFMDWAGTNNSQNKFWNDRTQKADPIQATTTDGNLNIEQGNGRKTCGVAWEWMMDLSNRNNSDIWINIPHRTIHPDDFPNGTDFNNDYMHKLAILIKTGVDMKTVDLKSKVGGSANLNQLADISANDFVSWGGVKTTDPLNSNLKIYIEYSNELFMRVQRYYADTMGQKLGMTGEWYHRYAMWAEIRMWKAFQDVFGSDMTNRVVKVASSRAGDEEVALKQAFDDVYNVITPMRNAWNMKADCWCTDTYTNPGTYSKEGLYSTAGNSPYIRTIWKNELEAKGNSVASLANFLKSNYNISLISYEGGQHFNSQGGQFAKNPEAYDMYFQWLEKMSQYCGIICNYAHYGPWIVGSGDISSWGALQYDGQDLSTAPKYLALRDWAAGISLKTDDEIIINTIAATSNVVEPIIYPNPLSVGKLQIKLMGEGIKRVEVYSSIGKLMLVTETIENSLSIDRATFQSGFYIVKTNQGTSKLIVK